MAFYFSHFFLRCISFQHPTIVSHHIFISFSLISLFHSLNILMESFTLFFTVVPKIFRNFKLIEQFNFWKLSTILETSFFQCGLLTFLRNGLITYLKLSHALFSVLFILVTKTSSPTNCYSDSFVLKLCYELFIKITNLASLLNLVLKFRFNAFKYIAIQLSPKNFLTFFCVAVLCLM